MPKPVEVFDHDLNLSVVVGPPAPPQCALLKKAQETEQHLIGASINAADSCIAAIEPGNPTTATSDDEDIKAEGSEPGMETFE